MWLSIISTLIRVSDLLPHGIRDVFVLVIQVLRVFKYCSVLFFTLIMYSFLTD